MWRPSKRQYFWERPKYLEDHSSQNTRPSEMKIKEGEKRNNFLCFAVEEKKLWKMMVMVTQFEIWYGGNDFQRFSKRIWRFWNRMASRAYPNYCIVEVGPNTEKTPGDMLRIADSSKWPSTYAGVRNLIHPTESGHHQTSRFERKEGGKSNLDIQKISSKWKYFAQIILKDRSNSQRSYSGSS